MPLGGLKALDLLSHIRSPASLQVSYHEQLRFASSLYRNMFLVVIGFEQANSKRSYLISVKLG